MLMSGPVMTVTFRGIWSVDMNREKLNVVRRLYNRASCLLNSNFAQLDKCHKFSWHVKCNM